MAIIVAAESGNWSVPATWVGGVKPGAADTAQTGGFTVTIDEDIVVNTLQVTVAGGFIVTAAPRSITVTSIATSVNLVTIDCQHNAGTVSVVWSVTTHSRPLIYNSGTGTLQITGNVQGGWNGSAYGVKNWIGGTVNVIGNAVGGIQADAVGAVNAGVGTITISGDATGGSVATAYGVNNVSTGTVAVGGTVYGGTVAGTYGLYGGVSGGLTTFKAVGSEANGNAALGGFCKIAVDAAVNRATYKRSDTGADYSLSVGGMLQANKRGNKQ